MSDASRRILVIDEDAVFRGLLTTLLQREGYAVDAVAGSQEAVARLEQVEPALVVLDVDMPEMSGLDLLRMDRTDAALRRTPFFMTSVDGAADRVKLAVLLGVSAFLLKPYDVHQLRAKLDEVLGSAHVPRLRAAA